ncbi:MAG: hypothetical protein NZ700_05920 [Gemmataceae bacterium]|nr:hypothetical protein [Gemmataceae bacterium]MDW8265053.1 hypothetical protein [Gemmataceae bacterium]
MLAERRRCPQCQTRLKVPVTSRRLKCPKCGAKFRTGVTVAPAEGVDAPDAEAAVPVAVVVSSVEEKAEPGPTPPDPRARRRRLLRIIGVALVLYLSTGLALAVWVFLPSDRSTEPAGNVPDVASRDHLTPDPPPDDEGPPQPRPNTLSPEQKAKVDAAIAKGVAYLKTGNDPRLRISDRDYVVVTDSYRREFGAVALVGLSLLECDVPASDPAVAAIVRQVREHAPSLGPRKHDTYGISIALMFLDKLGDPRDRELIRTLTLRLIAGQDRLGGWTYTCPLLSRTEEDQLEAYLQSLPTVAGKLAPDADGKLTPLPEAPVAIRRFPVVGFQPGDRLVGPARSDNSNTQFAILAVWAAQKHGLPVERTLAMAATRFRPTQGPDGSWVYNYLGRFGDPSQDFPWSMTCAGLLGLAVGRGVGLDVPADYEKLIREGNPQRLPRPVGVDLLNDPQVKKALRYLGQYIGTSPSETAGPERYGRNRLIQAGALSDLYFLWSLMRVAVVYDLTLIEGKDWYRWGCDLIVASPNADGSWTESFGGPVDTCFALLFLKQANVAKDLTAKLKLYRED